MSKLILTLSLFFLFIGCSDETEDPTKVDISFFKGQKLCFSIADVGQRRDSLEFLFNGYAEYNVDSVWTILDTTFYKMTFYLKSNDGTIQNDTILLSKSKRYIQLQQYNVITGSNMPLMKNNSIKIDSTNYPSLTRDQFPIIPATLAVGDKYSVIRPINSIDDGEVLRNFNVEKEYSINGRMGVLVSGNYKILDVTFPFKSVYSNRGKELSTFQYGWIHVNNSEGEPIDSIFINYCAFRMEERPVDVESYLRNLRPIDFPILK